MAAPLFELDVTTDAASGVVRLRLLDGAGQQHGAQQVRLDGTDASSWEGLFDTRPRQPISVPAAL